MSVGLVGYDRLGLDPAVTILYVSMPNPLSKRRADPSPIWRTALHTTWQSNLLTPLDSSIMTLHV